MRGRLRTILIILGLLIVVLLILPFVIPVNQFRPAVEKEASSALGRKVAFGGLSLSILTGPLSASNLSIADDPKFSTSPFLAAKSVMVAVESCRRMKTNKLLKTRGSQSAVILDYSVLPHTMHTSLFLRLVSSLEGLDHAN